MWNQFSRLLAFFENTIVGILIMYASIMLFTQIIARSVFNYSFSWAEESVRYAIIWMVFMASSIAFRQNAHISIDVVKQILPKSMLQPFQIAICIVCLITTLLLVWFGWELSSRMMAFGQRSSAMEAPMYLFYLSIPISATCMTIRIFESLVSLVKQSEKEIQTIYSEA